MDAPPVRYARTTDGYDIAYTDTGAGMPLVIVPVHLSHVENDWLQTAAAQPWLHGLSQRFRLIQYDPRGQGMSTRGLPAASARDDWLRDLDALVEKLRLDRFVLMGVNILGHLAPVYAARHPERLHALILMNCRVSVAGWMDPLVDQSWDLFLETQVPRGTPPDIRDAELARLRQAADRTDFLTFLRAFSTSDISEDARAIKSQTLLLHGRQLPWFGPEQARILAAQIENAQLVLIDGAIMPNAAQGLSAIDGFIANLESSSASKEGGPLPNVLSSRQIEVLRLIGAGCTNRQIANQLVLSERTVERHVADIYARLQLTNRAQAAVYAQQRGLV